MTRLVSMVVVAAALLGAGCEKSKSGSAEEAPIQKGSTPKPLPPPAPKEEPKTAPPAANGEAGSAAGSATGGGSGSATPADPAATPATPAGDPAATGPGMGAPPPANAPPPTVGAKLPMDTVRPPDASDLAAYVKGIPGKGKLRAAIETSMGTFHCELYEAQTPMTVANFVGLATGKKPWTDPRTQETMKNKPLYNGLIFHRVIPGFMIQGGDPLGKGIGGPGYNFNDEIAPGLAMDSGGLLAMANAGPGTNGSQFFITEAAASWLTGRHTIFGKCDEVDLVTKITGVERDAGDRPKTPVTIKKITFSRK